MKKVVIMAAIACVALAGCTRNERHADPADDVAIGFSPIAQRTTTRAEFHGEQNATYTGDGSTYEKFTAYAAFTSDNTTVPSTDFFPAAGEECSYNATGDYWAPATSYLWPKAGYLTFHAFSPSALTPCSGTVANAWTTGLTISNFVASTNMDQQVDVLYSDYNFYQQRSAYTPANGMPYDDEDNSAFTHNGVNLIFRHALSAVQFRVVPDQDYAPASANAKHEFTVTKIEVLNANNKGEFHENRKGDATNDYADAATGSITFNKDNALTASPYWVPAADETTYTVFTGATEVTTADAAAAKTFGDYGKMMLPMPQALAHSANDVSVKVTYNYKFTLGTEEYTYDNLTSTVSLAGAQAKKYNGAAEDYDVDYWLINHKYFYTLVFTLDPIIFDPKVEAFVEVSDINIDLPYQN